MMREAILAIGVPITLDAPDLCPRYAGAVADTYNRKALVLGAQGVAAGCGVAFLLTTAAATVLIGTLYPLVTEALDIGKITVGRPYFDGVFVPLMVPLVALLGLAGGIWSEKFDHIAAVTNFVITPLAFLSGTFYTVDRLPNPWHLVALCDPFFYMIDGFRYGFIGFADGSLLAGAIMVAVINLILAIACWALFQTGYRLKS